MIRQMRSRVTEVQTYIKSVTFDCVDALVVARFAGASGGGAGGGARGGGRGGERRGRREGRWWGRGAGARRTGASRGPPPRAPPAVAGPWFWAGGRGYPPGGRSPILTTVRC